MKKSIMTEMASAPPPPPPLSKVSRKTLIAVIVIVAIAAVAVGVYLATQSGGGGGGGGGTTTGIAGASSLQFSVSATHAGVSQGTYTYMAKNLGTSNLMIRIEATTSTGDNFIYIVNGAQQKAWMCSNGEWLDLSDAFTTQWNTWDSQWEGYQNNLAGWTGGDHTYTAPNGDTVRIYNITVNPSLADSLFQH
jgi:hypothetical protein